MKLKFKFGIHVGPWNWAIDVGTEPAKKLLGINIADGLFSVLTIDCPISLTLQVGW